MDNNNDNLSQPIPLETNPIAELETTKNESAVTPRKLHRRRKIRRLVEVSSKKQFKTTRARFGYKFKLGLLLITSAFLYFFLFGHYSNNNSPNASHKNYIENFFTNYRLQYNQIVYGNKNFCDRTLNTKSLFARIRLHQIINQDAALQELEVALKNNSRVNSIAVVGSSGLGKSLWARALEEHFPWQGNVHSYAWNTYVRNEVEKFHVLRMYVETLSKCGRNLIVIENLTPCDREVVNIFHKLVNELDDAENIHVIIVYIFKLNTMDSPALYNKDYCDLQNLPKTTTVNFRQFGKGDLIDCIKREANAENITLNETEINDIIKSIDVTQSGCKNVHAKVLLYMKKELEDLI